MPKFVLVLTWFERGFKKLMIFNLSNEPIWLDFTFPTDLEKDRT